VNNPRIFKEPFSYYLFGSLLIVVFSFIGGLLFMSLVTTMKLDFTSLHPEFGHNITFLTALVPFLFGLMGLIFAVRFIHKREFSTLISNRINKISPQNHFPLTDASTENTDDHVEVENNNTKRTSIDFSRIWFSFLLISFLSVSFYTLEIVLNPELYHWNFQFKPFLLLALISLLFIPIQAGLEELIFRGYLMQGFQKITRKRWIPIVLTSLIFASLHLLNPEIEKYGIDFAATFLFFGLTTGIIAYMDDGIELAIGTHIANNLFIVLMISTDWAVFQTDALYRTSYEPKLIEYYYSILIITTIYFFVFAKKYRWRNWKERLLGSH